MTYFEGFIVPVPEGNRDAYRQHAREFAPVVQEFGVARYFEAWESDVPDGKVTDFRKAVDAKPDEKIVFAFFEYPDKAARDAANEKFRTDPRSAEMGKNLPFDAQRLIMGGFEAKVDEGRGPGGYIDGFVVPVPEGKLEDYRQMAQKMAGKFLEFGALRDIEAVSDDVDHGKVTDYYRAVKAEDGEKIFFSFIEWPDKATRDEAWKKIMADESMKPEGEMPFDGKRMFWGGFEPVFDSARARETADA